MELPSARGHGSYTNDMAEGLESSRMIKKRRNSMDEGAERDHNRSLIEQVVAGEHHTISSVGTGPLGKAPGFPYAGSKRFDLTGRPSEIFRVAKYFMD